MKKTKVVIVSTGLLLLCACQTVPKTYNGVSGYQIERQTDTTAVLSYTLAAKKNLDLSIKRLQSACQKALKSNKEFKITVLSEQEIINPQSENHDQGVQIGNSRASFGLSNIPEHTNTGSYAADHALKNRPDTLWVIRYACE